ncbi:MAG: sulfatase-like hydrolase/transferase, partial [bacterium]
MLLTNKYIRIGIWLFLILLTGWSCYSLFANGRGPWNHHPTDEAYLHTKTKLDKTDTVLNHYQEMSDTEPAKKHGSNLILLVTLDTVRADHLSTYGYPRKTTPFLDRMARDGTTFERAFASMPTTVPSHATMFT